MARPPLGGLAINNEEHGTTGFGTARLPREIVIDGEARSSPSCPRTILPQSDDLRRHPKYYWIQ